MSNLYIECPCCGAQYAPGEVYIPKVFIGNPEYVKRNVEGKIDCVAGQDMDLIESYTCDYCKKSFKVTADISFQTIACENQFDTAVSIPYVERFKLKEF